jgi:dipeptidyl aminopeptidase/acylaminoacyl peptidase
MREIEQPVLVVQGVLDTQVALSNADRLAELARARNRKVPVEVVKIPGVNHLLVPATTGEVEEYATLTSRQISPDVPAAIAGWLQKTFAAMGR